MSDGKSELPQLPKTFPYDFLLVWDWDSCLDKSQIGNEYEDLMGHLAPKAPQAGLQTDCEKINRSWNCGMAIRDADRSIGDGNLRTAIEILEHVLSNIGSLALASLDRDNPTMGDDMKQLQGTINLIVKSKDGWTPLCLAAQAGCEIVVRLLLDNGQVDPNAHENRGETTLLKAAREGHERIVKLLLSTDKINPDMGGDKYEEVYRRWEAVTPLAEAAANGHEAIVKLLINTGKVDINAMSLGKTPLMNAAANGHTAIVELLLSTSEVEPDFGFNPEGAVDTALSLAVSNKHEAIVKLLLAVSQVPLDFEYGIDVWEGENSTLLSLARLTQHKGVIELLQRALDSQELSN